MKNTKSAPILLWITAILLCFFLYKIETHATPLEFRILSGLAKLLALVGGFLFFYKSKNYPQYKNLYALVFVSGTLFALRLLWNLIYRQYCDTHVFDLNIFRSIFYGYRAPLYGRTFDFDSIRWLGYSAIASLVFFGFSWFTIKNIKAKNWLKIYLVLFACLLLSVAYIQDWTQTFSNLCHYSTFADDLHLFKNTKELLLNYNGQMQNMEVHNNHYPPGQLLVLMAEKNLGFPFLKPLVFALLFTSIWPLLLILKTMKASVVQTRLTLLLYASTGALLFYPKYAVSPLQVMLSLFLFCFVLKYIAQQKFKYILGFSGVFSLYAFFSFSVFFAAAFAGIYLLFKLYQLEISTKKVALFVLGTTGIFICIYAVTFALSGFNLADTLQNAMTNNRVQMGAKNLNPLRYFITSSGNLLAYASILGLPILFGFLSFFNFPKQTFSKKQKALVNALVFAVIGLSFSNQFYLEIERIWIFLTPFFIIAIGFVLEKWHHQKEHQLLLVVITMNIFATYLFNLTINHCM